MNAAVILPIRWGRMATRPSVFQIFSVGSFRRRWTVYMTSSSPGPHIWLRHPANRRVAQEIKPQANTQPWQENLNDFS
jgi:hypothetical protein